MLTAKDAGDHRRARQRPAHRRRRRRLDEGGIRAAGRPFEARGKVTDEYLAAFRELWTKDAPSYRGEHVSFSDVLFYPKPCRSRIRRSGSAARARARCGAPSSLGDAWYPGNNSQTKPLEHAGTPRGAGLGLR
jgi:alkanesulfonate monooxygenase SsuD/methylene tetrahydromethanopterin reductase-like flavin-dependent oxidoreductase (luciferase family)